MTATAADLAVRPAGPPPADLSPALVCAVPAGAPEPLVVLADGCYETSDQRVFWRGEPTREVLRVGLDEAVAVRPLGTRPAPAADQVGERRLLAAVAAVRASRRVGVHVPQQRPACAPPVDNPLRSQLTAAVEAADPSTAHALAHLLWKQEGLPAVYRTLQAGLSRMAVAWAEGHGTVLAEHRATRAAVEVTDRLRNSGVAPRRRGTVVLAVPAGDRHTLGLAALGHLLQDAGWTSDVVDDLPLDELAEVASRPDTVAVVLSAHLPLTRAAARSLFATLRRAAPDVLLAVGGPGAYGISSNAGADLVGDDLTALLQALEAHTSSLTERESEVVLAVADGKTNAEIAAQLGLAPTTVKTHLDHIFTKTGTVHRAAAVASALRRGWIQ